LILDGDTEACPGVLPVPDREIESVESDAFELIVSLPAAAPLVCGLKLTWKVALCPALIVTGGLMPLNWKPWPGAVICEIVIALLSEFVTVSDRVLVVETGTVPNPRLAGLALREPEVVVPVPKI